MSRLMPAALIAALSVALPLALGAPAAPPAQDAADVASSAAPVSVVCVRHAEKASDGGANPELTPTGEERALALARTLGRAGVTHLFTSEYRRTRATLEPLAAATGIEIHEHPARDSSGLAALLRELAPGSVAVVAGHSNTVPALVEALGGALDDLEDRGRHGRTLREDEYDRLFVVTLPRDAKQAVATLELRYGEGG